LRDSAANSVIGRAANSSGVPADIATSTAGQVLRLSGTTLGFGAVDLDDTDAFTGTLSESAIEGDVTRDSEVWSGNHMDDGVSFTKQTNVNFISGDGITVSQATVANTNGITVALTDQWRYLYMDAGAMATNNTDPATPGNLETGDTDNLLTYDFHTFANTGSNGVTVKFVLPEGLNVASAMKAKLYWATTNVIATSETVSWELQLTAIAADAVLTNTTAFTAVVIDDDLLSTTSLDLNVSPASGDLTSSNPADADLFMLKIRRLSAKAEDDMDGDVRLLGVHLQYSVDSAVQAAW